MVQLNRSTESIGIDGTVLLEACRYNEWYRQSKDFDVVFNVFNEDLCYRSQEDCLNDDKEKGINIDNEAVIPIGSIEYVENHMRKLGLTGIQPINVPKELCTEHFLRREVDRVFKAQLDVRYKKDTLLFVKSDTHLKQVPAQVMKVQDMGVFGQDRLFISTPINFVAEWRVFVYNGVILDVKQYAGDWRVRYDSDTVTDMVGSYKDCPPAYTLDIGVVQDGIYEGLTVVIEVHNFISVGLYGFEDYSLLPIMYQRAYQYEISKQRTGN